jgi:pSer/pThr/pTyr-binding forkhead associated (FHA) protein
MSAVPAGPRLQDVGFAKLQGSGIDHVMRTYEIVLGRASKDARPDVVLGDTKSVSRQHARIYFNFDSGWSRGRV